MYFKYLITLLFVLLYSSCASKTTIKSLKSGKIIDSDIKNITISNFLNDNIGQKNIINDKISNLVIEGKNYFTIINRDNLKEILKEKKLNDSGLVETSDNYEFIPLIQAKTILKGKIDNLSKSTSHYSETRTNYDRCISYYKDKNGKSYCDKYAKYSVSCIRANYNLSTSINITKISNSKQIFSKTYYSNMAKNHCSDDYNSLLSKHEAGVIMASNIANQLIKDIAPSYVYYDVELFDSADIQYDDKSEDTLELSLKLIKNKRIQKANELLYKLNVYTKYKSYVSLYNYAITLESLGEYDKALSFYKRADDIYIQNEKEISEEINSAIIRVKEAIIENKKLSL